MFKLKCVKSHPLLCSDASEEHRRDVFSDLQIQGSTGFVVHSYRFVIGAMSTHLQSIMRDLPLYPCICIVIPDFSDQTLRDMHAFIKTGEIACSSAENHDELVDLLRLIGVDYSDYSGGETPLSHAEFDLRERRVSPGAIVCNLSESTHFSHSATESSRSKTHLLPRGATIGGNRFNRESETVSSVNTSDSLLENMKVENCDDYECCDELPNYNEADEVGENHRFTDSLSPHLRVTPGRRPRLTRERNGEFTRERYRELTLERNRERRDTWPPSSKADLPEDSSTDQLLNLSETENSSVPVSLNGHTDSPVSSRSTSFRLVDPLNEQTLTQVESSANNMSCCYVTSAGELTYSCRFCREFFPSAVDLAAHNNVFHAVRRFKCDFCEYSNDSKFHLKTHVLRVHLKVKNYNCARCKHRFFTATDLNRHMANMHSSKHREQRRSRLSIANALPD